MRWLLLLLLGCDQGRKPIVAPPVDKTIEQSIDTLAADQPLPRICFAQSRDHRTLACVDQVEARQDVIRGSRGVVLLGATSDSWTYMSSEDTGFDLGSAKAAFTPAVISELRTGLRDFIAFDAHGAALETAAVVGAHHLRRTREIEKAYQNAVDQTGDTEYLGTPPHDDRVELACGQRWVSIPLDQLLILYGDNVDMRVSPFGISILLEVEGYWGTEGESGKTVGAMLLDPASLCRL